MTRERGERRERKLSQVSTYSSSRDERVQDEDLVDRDGSGQAGVVLDGLEGDLFAKEADVYSSVMRVMAGQCGWREDGKGGRKSERASERAIRERDRTGEEHVR
jgi:hypothetical protein